MRRLALLLSALVALGLASNAQAKGPSAATIDGPGSGGGISIGGNGEPGSGATLGNLAEQSGLYAAASEHSLASDAPKGDLGPRYRVTYLMPGPNGEVDRIRQDLYPYAAAGPVSYTAPGQSFFGTERTDGGWFLAPLELKNTLVHAGLPARKGGQPAATPAPSSGDDGGTGFTGLWPAFGVALVLGLVALVSMLMRRRERTATT